MVGGGGGGLGQRCCCCCGAAAECPHGCAASVPGPDARGKLGCAHAFWTLHRAYSESMCAQPPAAAGARSTHREVDAGAGHSRLNQLNQLLHALACWAHGDGHCTGERGGRQRVRQAPPANNRPAAAAAAAGPPPACGHGGWGRPARPGRPQGPPFASPASPGASAAAPARPAARKAAVHKLARAHAWSWPRCSGRAAS